MDGTSIKWIFIGVATATIIDLRIHGDDGASTTQLILILDFHRNLFAIYSPRPWFPSLYADYLHLDPDFFVKKAFNQITRPVK